MAEHTDIAADPGRNLPDPINERTPRPLPRIVREAGLPDLHLIGDDWTFLDRLYQFARQLEADPKTTPRARLAYDAYATATLCRMAELAEDLGARS